MSPLREPSPDYYSILGVLRDATLDEITAAYYLLASKLHPDLTSAGDAAPDSADFKRINEAYQVLSDPHQRRQYDRNRRSTPGRRRVWPRSASAPTPNEECRSRADGAARRQSAATGADIHAELPLTPEEARFGGHCNINVAWIDICQQCHGIGRLQAAACPSCQGKRTCRRHETFDVNLPAPLRPGTVIRLDGKGNRTVHAQRRGDLFLHLVIKPCW